MNSYDYLRYHLAALAAAGLGVDSVGRDAFADADLSGYSLIDWAAGEQSTDDGVFAKADRDALAKWLDGGAGRALLANGSEIAWVTQAKGGKTGTDWLHTWFGAGYAADDAKTYAVQAAAGGAWSGKLDDGSHHAYDVDWPDVLKPITAKAVLNYGGTAGVAATVHAIGSARSGLVGFPLEAIVDDKARTALFGLLLDALAVKGEGFSCASSSGGGGDTGGGDTGTTDAGTTDAGTTDAGTTDGGATDAGPVDAGRADAGKPPLAPVAPGPKDDGCGCDVRSGKRGPDAGVLLVVLLCGLLLARRRIADTRPRA